MNLEKAADMLVKCKYADMWHIEPSSKMHIVIPADTDKYTPTEYVDPINNEDQRQALLEWLKISVFYNCKNRWTAQPEGSYTRDRGKTRLEAENACLEEILK